MARSARPVNASAGQPSAATVAAIWGTESSASEACPIVSLIWSGALPNLIADRPVVDEHFDWTVRPGLLARRLERLFGDTHMRAEQIEGFAEIRRRMTTEKPSGEIAAGIVLDHVRARRGA